MRILYKQINFIYPNIDLTSTKLAELMVSVSINGSDKVIFENRDMRLYEFENVYAFLVEQSLRS